MYCKKVEVINDTGIHARPASIFVKEATKFQSDLQVNVGGKSFNPKSIMSVLSAGIACGSEIEIRAEGPDEKDAVDRLVNLVKTGFGE